MSHAPRRVTDVRRFAALAVTTLVGSGADGQALERTLFVGNDGDLEGSLTSFTFGVDGELELADRVVTGSRATPGEPCPGCNAFAVALSPNGRFVAMGHASSLDPNQRLSILQVGADASLTLAGAFNVPTAPLDVVWLDNLHLAVTKSALAGGSQVRTYRFDPNGPALFQIDAEASGDFSSCLAVDRANGWLYAQDSTFNTITTFDIVGDGTLAPIQFVSTGGIFPLGLGLAPGGARLYGGGGTSGSGDHLFGYAVDTTTGTLGPLAGAPFASPGLFPFQVLISERGDLALVAHDGDATLRTCTIDPGTGALTPTGFVVDVGSPGELGGIAIEDGFVFVTDNSPLDGTMGVHSFTLEPGGALTSNGALRSTGGAGPRDLAVWIPEAPPCPADLNGNGGVDFADILAVIAVWGPCAACPEDLDESGDVGFGDILALIAAWGPCR